MAAWSDAEIEQARKYFAEGMSSSMIGRQIGRSRNAVIGKLARVGLSSAVQPTLRKPLTRQLGGFAARVLIGGARRKKAAAKAELQVDEPFGWRRLACHSVPGYSGKPLPLLELTSNQCRYPLDQVDGGPLLFCGAPTMGAGTSWCQYHFAVCYRPVPLPVRRRSATVARSLKSPQRAFRVGVACFSSSHSLPNPDLLGRSAPQKCA
jgi:hypothetical protein